MAQIMVEKQQLHKITTKPLAVVRYSAGQASDVKIWFDNYQQALKELNIVDKRNIINLKGFPLYIDSIGLPHGPTLSRWHIGV